MALRSIVSSPAFVDDLEVAVFVRPCCRLMVGVRAKGLTGWADEVQRMVVVMLAKESRWLFVADPYLDRSQPMIAIGRSALPVDGSAAAVFSILSLQAIGDLIVEDAAIPKARRRAHHYIIGFGDEPRARALLEALEQASLADIGAPLPTAGVER